MKFVHAISLKNNSLNNENKIANSLSAKFFFEKEKIIVYDKRFGVKFVSLCSDAKNGHTYIIKSRVNTACILFQNVSQYLCILIHLNPEPSHEKIIFPKATDWFFFEWMNYSCGTYTFINL